MTMRDVTFDAVAALVADQFPEWACLPISEVQSAGTVDGGDLEGPAEGEGLRSRTWAGRSM